MSLMCPLMCLELLIGLKHLTTVDAGKEFVETMRQKVLTEFRLLLKLDSTQPAVAFVCQSQRGGARRQLSWQLGVNSHVLLHMVGAREAFPTHHTRERPFPTVHAHMSLKLGASVVHLAAHTTGQWRLFIIVKRRVGIHVRSADELHPAKLAHETCDDLYSRVAGFGF